MIHLDDTPLYKAVIAYSASSPVPFHMPGHKLGKGLPEGPLKKVGLLDLTEIAGTDNLHFPEGAIREAQQLAARAFGAEESFFLVNGSTSGIHSAIMAVCRKGDKLIVCRDCHKSVINGIMLAGADPVYINPGFNKEFVLSTGTLSREVEKALEATPGAVGVFITRPNYYGICCDIDKIAAVVHSRGKILIVDEAHGAHLKFGKGLPACAMDSGADICIQSAHKTLPALTQGSYLHVRGNRVDRDRLKFYLASLQTSSPSYIIMASLDCARAVMSIYGGELLDNLVENVEYFKKDIDSDERLLMLSQDFAEGWEYDRTRVVINCKKVGKTGFSMEKMLRERYNIQVEMSDLYNIVCIGTVADRRQDYELLLEALKEIVKNCNMIYPLADINVKELKIPPQSINIGEIADKKARWIKLKESEGKVSSAMVTPYPPGIPVICPGEQITGELIEYIYAVASAGGNINGLTDSMEIRVAE